MTKDDGRELVGRLRKTLGFDYPHSEAAKLLGVAPNTAKRLWDDYDAGGSVTVAPKTAGKILNFLRERATPPPTVAQLAVRAIGNVMRIADAHDADRLQEMVDVLESFIDSTGGEDGAADENP